MKFATPQGRANSAPMAAPPENNQLIARLTPLADVLAMVEARVKPVAARAADVAVSSAASAASASSAASAFSTASVVGRVLAADAVSLARPTTRLSLTDGWAMNSDETLGAGSYAPATLVNPPQRIDAGQPMPPDTDSVAAFDVVDTSGPRAQALTEINPGEGVLPAGSDCDPAMPLRRAGERLRVADIAVFAAAGLARVMVREPRLQVLPVRGNALVAAAARMVASDIERCGGTARVETGRDLNLALAADGPDAIVVVGGTGRGRNDTSVQTLSRAGEVAVHGIALTPGETAAFGFVGRRPVLLLPGRLDAALAVWLTIGRQMLARLAGGSDDAAAAIMPLTRKVASPVGLAEFVPVRRVGDAAEPLAGKYLSLSTLSRADGWVLVPADSEGYAERSAVPVRAWP
jgi:molybdopterin biosynthesis enzyme